MSTTPLPRGPVRLSDEVVDVRLSDVVNQRIRALLLRTGGWLYGDTRAEYEQLVAEWTVAVAAERVEVVEAA